MADVVAEFWCVWYSLNKQLCVGDRRWFGVDTSGFRQVEPVGVDETRFWREEWWQTRQWPSPGWF